MDTGPLAATILSLTLICTVSLSSGFGSEFTIGPTEFTGGAVPIKEPDNGHPLMYSSVLPVMYKFLLPRWDLRSMKIQFWKSHNNCTESDRYEDGYPCPIVHHMNYLIDFFTGNMTSWNNLFMDNKGKASSPVSYSNDFLEDPRILWKSGSICSNLRIQPHFSKLRATSKQLKTYIETLSQCGEKREIVHNLKIVNMTDLSYYLENLYHYTFSSFTSDYWNLLSSQHDSEGLSLVAWTTLQSGLMVHQFMESQKVAQALEICKNHQIPWTMIKADSLRKLLQSLKTNFLEDENYDFSIPLENLSKYFKLPLADCIFDDDGTFLVRILVPLVPKEAASKNYFVRFNPVPFVAQGKVCSVLGGKSSIPFNPGLNGILPCSCSKFDTFCKAWSAKDPSLESEMCQSYSNRGQEESCIHALASDLQEEILSHCPLQCNDISSISHNQLEIVLQSNDTSTTKIVPAPLAFFKNKSSLHVQCSGSEKMALPNLELVGAYQMTLPHNCKLVPFSESLPLAQNVTFLDGVTIEHLMPYQWMRGISLDGRNSDGESDKEEAWAGVDPRVAKKFKQLDESCSKSLSEILLWLMVLCLVVCNIGLVINVFHLRKWKQDQMYKSTSRLIYNAAPIDENNEFPVTDM